MCQMGMRDHRRCQSSPSGWWWLLPGPPASAGCRSRDQVDRTYQLAHTAARRSGAPSSSTMPIRGIFAPCWARAPIGHATAPPPSRVKNSRRLVCRERSIVRGDEGRIMTRPSSRPEARRRLGCETANELGAPVASSIPAQLPGHEPASARMGYEDGHALILRYRRVEGLLGRGGAA